MDDEARARELIDAPRGRRLCAEAALRLDDELWTLLFQASEREPEEVAAVVEALARTSPEPIASLGAAELLLAYSGTTDSARYWQDPDEMDGVLELPAIRAALLPLARALVANPNTKSWGDGVDASHQFADMWLNDGEFVAQNFEALPAALREWRKLADLDETRASKWWMRRRFPISYGWWWSHPSWSAIPGTTAMTPNRAYGLWLVEDSHQEHEAQLQPVEVSGEPRVFEIDGPSAWAELVARYPLNVASHREETWTVSTGVRGTWLVPDWLVVAEDYDAVHLSLWGYLTTAGLALSVPGTESHTILAGWGPDTSYWFADVLAPKGDIQLWEKSDEDVWTRSS